MKVVLIGYGSIGRRHVNNLISLGINEITLFRRKKKGNHHGINEINNIDQILEVNPDFVIVSNPTALHYKYLKFLIKSKLNILCEKPLLNKPSELVSLNRLLKDYDGIARIAFNLRHHPCIVKVKEIIKKSLLGRLHSARFFVGQYLPDWKPKTNHLENYSAKSSLGGGVIFDLVHEIDIAEYLINKPKDKVYSIARKISNVTIDSEDIAEIIYNTSENVLVNIHLDYLYRGYSRNFYIGGSKCNLYCDLFNNSITIKGEKNQLIESYNFKDFQINDMYIDLLNDYINIIKKKDSVSILSSFNENQSVMETCFKIKKNQV